MTERRTQWNSTLPASDKPWRKRRRAKRGKGSRERRAIRAALRFAKHFHSVPYVEFTKAQYCRSCGRPATEERLNDTSHAEKRQKCDWRRTFPQCRDCHREFELNPMRFLARRGYTIAHLEHWIASHLRRAVEAGVIQPHELEAAA